MKTKPSNNVISQYTQVMPSYIRIEKRQKKITYAKANRHLKSLKLVLHPLVFKSNSKKTQPSIFARYVLTFIILNKQSTDYQLIISIVKM